MRPRLQPARRCRPGLRRAVDLDPDLVFRLLVDDRDFNVWPDLVD